MLRRSPAGRWRRRGYRRSEAWARAGNCSVWPGGPLARHGDDGGGRRRAGGRHVLACPWRMSWKSSSSTGLARSNDDVQELADVEGSRWVKGERERGCEVTRRGDVLTRPERRRARSGASSRHGRDVYRCCRPLLG